MGTKIMDFINAQTAAGRVVYARNYLTAIKITKKAVEAGCVRLNGEHVEIQRGKRWESINGMTISAI